MGYQPREPDQAPIPTRRYDEMPIPPKRYVGPDDVPDDTPDEPGSDDPEALRIDRGRKGRWRWRYRRRNR